MQNAHASIDRFVYWSDLKETHMSNCDFSSFGYLFKNTKFALYSLYLDFKDLIGFLLPHLLHGNVPGRHGDRIVCSHCNKNLLYCRTALHCCVHGFFQLCDLTTPDPLVHRDDCAGLSCKKLKKNE